MLVKEVMSTPVVTVTPETSMTDALKILRERHIRRLPVVSRGRLVGIVTELDIVRASPSPVTSLSVAELAYLVPKITVKEIMTKDPLTIDPNAPIERAAVIMRDRKIGGLPVVEGDAVVGIITESDIFDAFLSLLGATRPTERLTIDYSGDVQELMRITECLAHCEIHPLNMAVYRNAAGQARVILRLEAKQAERAIQLLRQAGIVVHTPATEEQVAMLA